MQYVLSFDQLCDVYEDLVQLQTDGELDAPMCGWRPDGANICQSMLGALVPTFNIDRYPSILDKAARILVGIVCGHPLQDGNKRFGVFAAHRQLLVNGLTLDMSDAGSWISHTM